MRSPAEGIGDAGSEQRGGVAPEQGSDVGQAGDAAPEHAEHEEDADAEHEEDADAEGEGGGAEHEEDADAEGEGEGEGAEHEEDADAEHEEDADAEGEGGEGEDADAAGEDADAAGEDADAGAEDGVIEPADDEAASQDGGAQSGPAAGAHAGPVAGGVEEGLAIHGASSELAGSGASQVGGITAQLEAAAAECGVDGAIEAPTPAPVTYAGGPLRPSQQLLGLAGQNPSAFLDSAFAGGESASALAAFSSENADFAAGVSELKSLAEDPYQQFQMDGFAPQPYQYGKGDGLESFQALVAGLGKGAGQVADIVGVAVPLTKIAGWVLSVLAPPVGVVVTAVANFLAMVELIANVIALGCSSLNMVIDLVRLIRADTPQEQMKYAVRFADNALTTAGRAVLAVAGKGGKGSKGTIAKGRAALGPIKGAIKAGGKATYKGLGKGVVALKAAPTVLKAASGTVSKGVTSVGSGLAKGFKATKGGLIAGAKTATDFVKSRGLRGTMSAGAGLLKAAPGAVGRGISSVGRTVSAGMKSALGSGMKYGKTAWAHTKAGLTHARSVGGEMVGKLKTAASSELRGSRKWWGGAKYEWKMAREAFAVGIKGSKGASSFGARLKSLSKGVTGTVKSGQKAYKAYAGKPFVGKHGKPMGKNGKPLKVPKGYDAKVSPKAIQHSLGIASKLAQGDLDGAIDKRQKGLASRLLAERERPVVPDTAASMSGGGRGLPGGDLGLVPQRPDPLLSAAQGPDVGPGPGPASADRALASTAEPAVGAAPEGGGTHPIARMASIARQLECYEGQIAELMAQKQAYDGARGRLARLHSLPIPEGQQPASPAAVSTLECEIGVLDTAAADAAIARGVFEANMNGHLTRKQDAAAVVADAQSRRVEVEAEQAAIDAEEGLQEQGEAGLAQGEAENDSMQSEAQTGQSEGQCVQGQMDSAPLEGQKSEQNKSWWEKAWDATVGRALEYIQSKFAALKQWLTELLVELVLSLTGNKDLARQFSEGREKAAQNKNDLDSARTSQSEADGALGEQEQGGQAAESDAASAADGYADLMVEAQELEQLALERKSLAEEQRDAMATYVESFGAAYGPTFEGAAQAAGEPWGQQDPSPTMGVIQADVDALSAEYGTLEQSLAKGACPQGASDTGPEHTPDAVAPAGALEAHEEASSGFTSTSGAPEEVMTADRASEEGLADASLEGERDEQAPEPTDFESAIDALLDAVEDALALARSEITRLRDEADEEHAAALEAQLAPVFPLLDALEETIGAARAGEAEASAGMVEAEGVLWVVMSAIGEAGVSAEGTPASGVAPGEETRAVASASMGSSDGMRDVPSAEGSP